MAAGYGSSMQDITVMLGEFKVTFKVHDILKSSVDRKGVNDLPAHLYMVGAALAEYRKYKRDRINERKKLKKGGSRVFELNLQISTATEIIEKLKALYRAIDAKLTLIEKGE